MRVSRITGIAALFLLLAAPASVFAQKDDHAQGGDRDQAAQPDKQQPKSGATGHEGEQKPATQQQKPQQAATVKQDQQQPKQQAKEQTGQQAQPQAKPVQRNEQANSERPAAQPAQAKQENHSTNFQPQHPQRTVAEQQTQRSEPALRLSVRSDSRIPDERFRSSFGRTHEFRVGNPEMVGGYSRFEYGGYWFGFVQPWPVGWYYTDDVYVDYIDGGYYLCNPSYPNARVSISVVL
jgi:hypothetical protein